LAENSSFGFFSVGLCVGKKPNVLFVRLAFLVQILMFSTIFRIMHNVFVYNQWRILASCGSNSFAEQKLAAASTREIQQPRRSRLLVYSVLINLQQKVEIQIQ